MISKVIIRNFKRFDEVKFIIPGHVVLAGPNNTGKTTLLQAISSWSLALNLWKQKNDYNSRRGGYTKYPIARQTFSSVPLRNFDLLWTNRTGNDQIEIEVHSSAGWNVTMEFIWDTTEQIYVRPKITSTVDDITAADISVVFVPPMTGLSTDEPVYQSAKIEQLLGQGKPGDVLRNLLVEANNNQPAWEALKSSIAELFNYELLPPNASGADIIAEYKGIDNGNSLDIASAGSGFQQVLMLLTFLNTREGSLLLLDEPDAHLHVILQDAIYSQLRSVASKQNSQLIIATHSEIIIDSVEPRELCVMLNEPKLISDSQEKSNLIRSLSVLSNTDIMLAMDAPGIIYTEGHTDLEILKEWSKILNHPAYGLLTKRLFWRATVWENRHGSKGIKAQEHYEALGLIRDNIPGIILLDGDDNLDVTETEINGVGLQRLRWRRYEIESYLVHPDVLRRFVRLQVGDDVAQQHIADLDAFLTKEYPPGVLDDPLSDHEFLNSTKARTRLLPPALDAAGLHGFPYTRFHEIAACMQPGELHTEIKEKLDNICRAFGINPNEPA
ncbi:MAG: AAA family ATPase [Proteobacteria bacterium]|nr:AAA family ATPase [Pseudomonadota bacterium]